MRPTFPRESAESISFSKSPIRAAEARSRSLCRGRRAWDSGSGSTSIPIASSGSNSFWTGLTRTGSGASPPHEVDLVWDSINFPSSERVVRTASFSFEAPPAAGRMEELTLSFNAVARWKFGSVVSGSVSGGLSYFRLRAEDLEVGALAGWLGGHAVLFTELYQMSLATETADTLGFDLGGDVSVALGPKVAVFADGRYFYGPKTGAPIHLGSFASDNVVTVPIDRVETFLALPPVELDPRYFRLLFGVKWRL